MDSLPVALPRIAAFEKLGFGMFVHWGLYSLFGRGEWAQYCAPVSREEYEPLIRRFTAEEFSGEELARTAREAGMRYIVLTTRHHEGFSLYDTCGLSDFDAPHSPAKRDLVADFVAGCRKYDIIPFFYHTTIDWHWKGKFTKDLSQEEFRCYLKYLRDSVEILCTNYGKIGGLWFDGNWWRPGDDWQEDEMYGMIRSHQPDAIIVNNTGLEALGKTGHPEIDSVTYENNSATPMDRRGMKKYVAGEVCKTMNHNWGIGIRDFNFLSPADIIRRLCQSRGCGANFLLNIGPSASGAVPAYEKAALGIVGRWCKLFGEAVYETKPVPGVRCSGQDFVLRNGKNFYCFIYDMNINGDNHVIIPGTGNGLRGITGFPEKVRSAVWLDSGEPVEFIQNQAEGLLAVNCSGYPYGVDTVVRVIRLVTE